MKMGVSDMTSSALDRSQNAYARLAGFMYLFVDLAYLVGLFITSRFQVAGNVMETAHRIVASESLYRIGLSSLLVGALCTVSLAIGLYGTVQAIDNKLALQALVFRVVEASVFAGVSVLNFAFLQLYVGPGHLNAFDASQLSAILSVRSAAVIVGFNVAAIFFSMGSVLFFYLFMRSTYLPRALSAVGVFGSLLVPIVCFGSLIAPQAATWLLFGWIPVGFAEIAAGLLLLVKGVASGGPSESAPETS
jgi:Domain of unknown function (DUF4386)